VLTVSVPGSVADTHMNREWYKNHKMIILRSTESYTNITKRLAGLLFYYTAELLRGHPSSQAMAWASRETLSTLHPQRRIRILLLPLKKYKGEMSTNSTQQVLSLKKSYLNA